MRTKSLIPKKRAAEEITNEEIESHHSSSSVTSRNTVYSTNKNTQKELARRSNRSKEQKQYEDAKKRDKARLRRALEKVRKSAQYASAKDNLQKIMLDEKAQEVEAQGLAAGTWYTLLVPSPDPAFEDDEDEEDEKELSEVVDIIGGSEIRLTEEQVAMREKVMDWTHAEVRFSNLYRAANKYLREVADSLELKMDIVNFRCHIVVDGVARMDFDKMSSFLPITEDNLILAFHSTIVQPHDFFTPHERMVWRNRASWVTSRFYRDITTRQVVYPGLAHWWPEDYDFAGHGWIPLQDGEQAKRTFRVLCETPVAGKTLLPACLDEMKESGELFLKKIKFHEVPHYAACSGFQRGKLE